MWLTFSRFWYQLPWFLGWNYLTIPYDDSSTLRPSESWGDIVCCCSCWGEQCHLLDRRWNIRHLVLHRTVPTMKNCPEYCMVFKCPSWYPFRKLKILLIWVSFYTWWWSESQFIYWNKVHLHSLISVTFFKLSKTHI